MFAMYDIVLKDGLIIDGTGARSFRGSVALTDGKIAYVGTQDNLEGKKVIDCRSLHITPGFIDAHSHGDIVLGHEFPSFAKLSQGITTEVVGQCGISMAPVSAENIDKLLKYVESFMISAPEDISQYITYKGYRDCVKKQELYLNCRFLVGHGTLRIAVMGYEDRKPSAEEMELMKSMLREAMENGALGMSTGLIYAPGVYADTEELVELCKVVSEYGGLYVTHMRNESFDVVKSVKEAIHIAREAGTALQISHHKVAGSKNWGLSKETLRLVDEARASGMKITLDQYPYEAGMTHLNVLIPPQYLATGIPGLVKMLRDPVKRAEIKEEMIDPKIPFDNFYHNCGGFKGVFVTGTPKTPEADGQLISDYAQTLGKDEFETYFDLLLQNDGLGTGAFFAMGAEDMERIISYPYTMPGSDGIVKRAEDPTHPRGLACFPRAICHFVKERRLMSLEEMIYKMTLLPAQSLGMPSKGALKEGLDADITVFDYEKLHDEADYQHPKRVTAGMKYVFVNGKLAYENGVLKAKGLGKVL